MQELQAACNVPQQGLEAAAAAVAAGRAALSNSYLLSALQLSAFLYMAVHLPRRRRRRQRQPK